MLPGCSVKLPGLAYILVVLVCAVLPCFPKAGTDPDTDSRAVIITRPRDLSIDGKIEDKWFLSLSEQYMYMRLYQVGELRVIDYPVLTEAITGLSDITDIVPDHRYFSYAKDINADYLVRQRYEIVAKVLENDQISYMAEVVDAQDKQIVTTCEALFTVDKTARVLDSCVTVLLTAMGVKNGHLSFSQSLLSESPDLVEEFGGTLLSYYYRHDRNKEEIAQSLSLMARSDRGMKLATYHAGNAWFELGQWDRAATQLSNLVTLLSNPFAKIYVFASQAHLRSGNYDEAVRIANVGMREDFAVAQLQIHKAEALAAQGKENDAFTLYKKLYERDSLLKAAIYIARYHNRHNEPGTARTYAARILRSQVQNVPALVELGKSHILLGDYRKGIEHLEEASVYADSILHTGDSLRAVAYIKLKEYERAARLYDTLYSRDGGNLSLLKSAAQQYEQAQKREQAVARYEEYIARKKPEESDVYLTVAKMYEAQGGYREAAQRYVDAYEKGKEQAHLKHAGQLLFEHGYEEDAQQLFERYIDEGYSDIVVRTNLVKIYYSDKEYAEVTDVLGALDYASELEVPQLMMVAEAFFLQQKYKRASAFLTRVRARDPDNTKALLYSALTMEKLGNAAQASELYRKYVQRAPQDSVRKYGFRCAQLYEKAEDHESAVAQYRKNISRFPEDVRNYTAVVSLYEKRGNTEASLRMLAKAVKQFPDNTGFSCTYANLLEKSGQAQKALEYFDACRQKNGDDSVFMKMADIYYKEGDYSNAASSYKKAVARAPYDWKLHYRLGAALFHAGDAGAAIGALKEARQFKENDTGILALLDSCYRRLGKNTERIPVLKTLVDKSEGKEYSRTLTLGALLMEAGRFTEAITYLRQAQRQTESDPEPSIRLARIHIQKQKYEKVIAHLKKALQLGDHSFDTYMHLARAYTQQGRHKEAANYYYKAVEKQPDNAAAHFWLSRALAQAGNEEASFSHLKDAYSLAPQNREYAVAFARELFNRGDAQAAAQKLRAILKNNTGETGVLMDAARIYSHIGQIDSARLLYQRALRNDPQCALCIERIADIYFTAGDYHSASTFYERLLRQDEDVKARENLAISLLKQGDGKEASSMLESLLARTGSNRSRFWLGHYHLSNNDVAMARRLLQNARTQDGWYYLLLARVAEKRQDYKEAYKNYMIAQRALTGKVEALAGCGRMNLKKGDYDRAVHFFGKALGIQPKNPSLLLGIAHAYEMKKDFKSAISIYEKAIERRPDDREVYYATARAYSKKGEHIEAVALLKKGLSRVDNPATLYMALGHEYRITSQFRDAIDAYRKAAKKGKKAGVEAYRYIGNIYYGQLKQKKKAKKYYKKYINKDGEKALQVRRVLKRM